MAETHVNFLAGSPLNRLSWLRTSTPFLNAILARPETRWVLFKNGEPLVRVDKEKNKNELATLRTIDLLTLLRPLPIFGQGKEPGEAAQLLDGDDKPISHVEAARLHGLGIVFLGLHEPEGAQVEGSKALPSQDFAKTDPHVAVSNVSGTAYFGMDVSSTEENALGDILKDVSDDVPESDVDGELAKFKQWTDRLQSIYLGKQSPSAEDAQSINALFSEIEIHSNTSPEKLQSSGLRKIIAYIAHLDNAPESDTNISDLKSRALALTEKLLPPEVEHNQDKSSTAPYEFMEPRAAAMSFTAFDAAILAEARSMTDWNSRNKFCPGCGSPTYSLWAGWKRACSTLLPWADTTGKKSCPSAIGLNNFSHPRTDGVVIMAIIDESGDKILLGKNKRFPHGRFYSILAGFIEPGESFEDAVKREIWEEAGVRVWGVKYHSSQPWPFPANLMVGFYAFADSSQPVRVDLDNELIEARWFTRDEVQSVLAHNQGSIITRQEHKVFDNQDSGNKTTDQQTTEAIKQPTTETAKQQEAPAFRVPPSTAIAGVLIRDWANGRIGAGGSGGLRKGNL
ncbi:uncharacterized protein FOMMEDRAFT_19958 [Fomitiporia mediterranea MF3/22]|uniref:uncharacterized protein n=1 Tax=Fomitiporia mediterranea (strain MF3/22) TaxID=694068 RepID=UPI0004408633|nr:uncharacterized protein FOMMEDRAFT_19958 [Fomitiporia mediterranea MF3/22]EJD02674.1 hypothetical protein FOMMEDRAFT_19958 [Fomitiporia mediterranea MF3/22]